MKANRIIIGTVVLVLGFCVSPALAQFGIFDKTVDWPIIGSSHAEGSVEVSGSGANEKYTVKGNGSFGARIEGGGYGVAGDEGFYVYTDRTGSWTMQARLFPYFGQCALMIRENGDDPASNFYSVELANIGEAVHALFRTRFGAGGNVSLQLFGPDGEPIQDSGDGLWLRVTRIEPVDAFFGEYSPDGQNWFIADNRVIDWPSDTAAFGIAAGSGGDNEDLGEVEVTEVSFGSTPPVAFRSISQQSFMAGDTLDVSIRVFVSGEDRSTATVVETVPAGWEVSGIDNGGQESNGVITWSLTGLPVGDTVVTYQVTASSAPEEFAEWSGIVQESVGLLGMHTLPLLNITGGDRVTDGLVVLYTFDEGSGILVRDVSGVGEPMNLYIEDESRAYWGDGYLETTNVNHIESDGPATKIIEACIATNEITIEGWIKSSDITQNGTARVITCSIDAADRNFTLGQGHYAGNSDCIEMRFRTDIDPSNPNNVIATYSGGGTFTEALSHVVFTRNIDWEVYGYVNNVSYDLSGGLFVDGDFSTWDETYKFGLSNEVSADRAWLGQFHLVAIYNRGLTAEEVSQNYNAGPFLSVDVDNWTLY